jgi:hypothetical protein
MSSINPNNIDGTYPIAGQDNDSQGFRDNFTNIKNNLKFAQEELADLQARALLNQPLGSVGQTSTSSNNELNYAQLSGAQLVKSVYTTSNIGVPSTDPTISFTSGNFQRLILDQSRTITFSNWPTTGLYATLRLQITVANTSARLTLPSAVSTGLNKLANANVSTKTLSYTSLDSGNVRLYEFSTFDAGGSITVLPLYQPY